VRESARESTRAREREKNAFQVDAVSQSLSERVRERQRARESARITREREKESVYLRVCVRETRFNLMPSARDCRRERERDSVHARARELRAREQDRVECVRVRERERDPFQVDTVSKSLPDERFGCVVRNCVEIVRGSLVCILKSQRHNHFVWRIE